MARNGSGTYVRTDGVRTGATVFQQESAAGIDIEAVNLDVEAQDMAAALTASIANDGQTPILANLPMSTFKHTGVGAATARTDYLRAAEGQDGTPSWASTFGGTANALTTTLAPVITAYTAGLVVRGIVLASNTGSATLNANAVGTITIKKKLASGKVALTGGEMIVGTIVEFVSDGTDLILSNKPEWQPSAALTSAATVDLATTTGEYALVNGSTGPITALGTLPAGTLRVLRFASTPTITHNATSLILPGAVNIVAAAGDVMAVISEGAGNWRCLLYQLASGGTAGLTWSRITANPSPAVVKTGYLCDTSGGAFTITLPAAPAVGAEIRFIDGAGTFNSNALTLGRNALNIMGLAEDLLINTRYWSGGVVYDGATNGWRLN